MQKNVEGNPLAEVQESLLALAVISAGLGSKSATRWHVQCCVGSMQAIGLPPSVFVQAAEQADPNYIYGTELREGVLSYLGRAQYLNGNYAQARQTLEKALSQHKGDVARPYLGLTLYRLGDQKAALTNI
jgi:tetratricopeptide (TPR) repeat protein